MKCLRCIETMEPADLAGHAAWSCIYCQGHWVEFEILQKVVDQFVPGQNIPSIGESTEPGSPAPGTRICPSCSGLKLYSVKANDLEIDICKSCRGLFFDDGELERITGELPEKSGMPLIGWVLVAVVARAALFGTGGSA